MGAPMQDLGASMHGAPSTRPNLPRFDPGAVWQTPSGSGQSGTFAPGTFAPSSFAPGSTSLVPIEGAENAMPQLLAWNSGTTGSIVSAAFAPSESPVLAISACSTLERCEYNTPLGSPVVPEV